MLPPSAEILDIGVQGYDVILWYSFEDHEEHSVQHEFTIVATGGTVPSSNNQYWTHMKTVFDDKFVWHIYKK